MGKATTLAGEVETAKERRGSFPETEKLGGAIEVYRKSNDEASDLEGKQARLEIDEAEILNDVRSDEETQCKALADVRIRKDVQARRTSHKRLEVSRLLNELEEAYGPAEAEIRAAHRLEFMRRQGILADRVKAILGLGSEDWQAIGWVWKAVAASAPITALSECGPNANAAFVKSIEQRAIDLIEVAKRLEAEIGKEI
jgi:hypothetical protein